MIAAIATAAVLLSITTYINGPKCLKNNNFKKIGGRGLGSVDRVCQVIRNTGGFSWPNKLHTLFSALDKLLGQLGIYPTWLSSIAYLQKQLGIFRFFMPRFFFFDYTFSYCMMPSGMCLHIYSLPLSAFLKYQTSGFYCT